MKASTSSTGAGRRLRKSRGEDGRTPASRRLKSLASAFAKDAGLDILTEAQQGACRRAASGTLQLESMDAALGRGEEIDALAYSRLDGVVRRNLRALGLEENDDAPAKIGKKKVAPMMSLRDEMEANEAERWAKLTDEERQIEYEDEIDQKGHDDWRREDQRRRARGEKSLPEPRDPYAEFQDKVSAERKLEKNYGKKTFHAHQDSPRSNE